MEPELRVAVVASFDALGSGRGRLRQAGSNEYAVESSVVLPDGRIGRQYSGERGVLYG